MTATCLPSEAFVYGVKTTGIFCRPDCPSRQPLPKNVVPFASIADAEAAGFRACKRCRPADLHHPEASLMEAACRFIDKYAESFQLSDLAKHMGYSQFHLQRTFKAALGITPRAYAESRRLTVLKQKLRNDRTVTESLYEAGFSSPSRVYESSNQHFGMTPATYRKHGRGTRIRYTIADCPLGRLLVAETDRGVCSITFGDADGEMEAALTKEFPEAAITRSDSGHVAAILAHMDGSERLLRLPLDIQATAFQRRVWEHLQTIPYGETRSYSQVAQELQHPKATRAVARACATNPVALAIPCHRVVREGGALSGYRWGLKRKQALLEQERL